MKKIKQNMKKLVVNNLFTICVIKILQLQISSVQDSSMKSSAILKTGISCTE